jgi:thiosulfate reductase cytochrome b subunit
MFEKKNHLDTTIVKRTTENALEYLTLQKMLYTALLMMGHLISYGGLSRYTDTFFHANN